MTEKELLYIIKIDKCHSITQAASELFITQPALSQTLSKIEAEYEQILFIREADGLITTPFGEKFVITAKKILNRYHSFEHELNDFRSLRKGEIRFGLPQYLGTLILPIILPKFSSMYPHVKVQYYEANSEELGKMLQDGIIDFAIRHFQDKEQNTQYQSLFHDRFMLITPNRGEHIDSWRKPITDLKPFSSENFILISKGYKSRDIADSILSKAGITPNILYTTKSMETAKRLVASGLGVTFLPCTFLQLFSTMAGLHAYQLSDDLQASWELVLSTQKGSHLSNTTVEFIKLLKAHLSQMT